MHLSNQLTDKTIIRQLGLELGLTAHEIQKHFVTHSPDTTKAAHTMVLSWISGIKDRKVAHRKLVEAVMKAELTLSQGEQNFQVRISLFGDNLSMIRTVLFIQMVMRGYLI